MCLPAPFVHDIFRFPCSALRLPQRLPRTVAQAEFASPLSSSVEWRESAPRDCRAEASSTPSHES